MTTFMLFRTVILSSEIISCKSRLLSWCKCAKSLSMIVKSLPFIEITFVSFGRFAGMCCRFAWSQDILSSVFDWTILEVTIRTWPLNQNGPESINITWTDFMAGPPFTIRSCIYFLLVLIKLKSFFNKSSPRPGIEPGPPGWKPGILTPRPSGKLYNCIRYAYIKQSVKIN